MTRRVDDLWSAIDGERRRRTLVPSRPNAAWRELELEEIRASTALAGSRLTFDEVALLVGAGRVPGGRLLRECLLVADYAAASAFVRQVPAAGRRQPFVRVDEIVGLHARALARDRDARPGVWRATTAPALANGTVPSPAWLVAREVAAFAERFGTGPVPGANPLRWVAEAHVRFSRIRPFTAGNGRTARLLCNLLLRRLELPPLVVTTRDSAAYAAACANGDVRRLEPLAHLIGRSVLEGIGSLDTGGAAGDRLRPLAGFADGAQRAALYKAAQRGRLRTLRRGSSLLTTSTWIDDYVNRKSR